MTKVTNTTEFYGVCAAPLDLSKANPDRRFSVLSKDQVDLLLKVSAVHGCFAEVYDVSRYQSRVGEAITNMFIRRSAEK